MLERFYIDDWGDFRRMKCGNDKILEKFVEYFIRIKRIYRTDVEKYSIIG